MQTFDGERCLYGALNNAVRQQLRKAGFQRAGKHLEAASYSLSSCLVIDKVVLLLGIVCAFLRYQVSLPPQSSKLDLGSRAQAASLAAHVISELSCRSQTSPSQAS